MMIEDHARYYKEELQELEKTGRGGTDGALLLKNYIRDLEMQVQQNEEHGKREIEILNNAKSIEEMIIIQIIKE
jgi:hypothetical protein